MSTKIACYTYFLATLRRPTTHRGQDKKIVCSYQRICYIMYLRDFFWMYFISYSYGYRRIKHIHASVRYTMTYIASNISIHSGLR